MSERIKVGDLVMIVRGHECVMNLYQGVIFTVTGFVQPRFGGWHCARCGRDNAGGNEAAATGFHKAHAPISWLKKIPPLTEPETVERKEELPA